MWGTRSTALAALAGLALGLAGAASAQEIPGIAPAETAAAEADPTAPEEIRRRAEEASQELSAAERRLAAASDAADRSHLEQKIERLRRIDDLLRKQAKLADPPSAPVDEPEALDLEGEPSVFELNRLHELRFEKETKDRRRAEAALARREALATAKEKFEEAERARREARSAFEAATDPVAKARAEREFELRRLESRAARERVTLRELESERARLRQEEGAEVAGLDERIARVRDALASGVGEPADGYAKLAEQERTLRREREGMERRLSTVELLLEAAQQRFSRQLDPPKELLDEVEAVRARRDLIRQEIALVDARIERLAGQQTLWRNWSATLGGKQPREQLEAWRTEAEERLEALEQTALDLDGRRADLERRLEAMNERLLRLPGGSRLRPVLEEQRKAQFRLLESERAELADLALDRRLTERVLEELNDRTGQFHPLEYAARGVQSLRDVWSYEITTVDDAPITVGSLFLALLLASAGLWASRRGSVLVGRLATTRFKLDAGASGALQTLSFYLLLVTFTMLALRAVHFPLTAFTVLGGALAIGIGFGSQNVMNNFISGLIIMLERPIRLGDVVEVNDNHGTIEKIGARSTQIRSMDGRHIVVPNSFFLENNVVNWTLSDDLVRTSVLVGVIYGSPTELVRDLIAQVVREDDQILDNPAPIIIFDEFGDNSLNFEVHFWVRARSPMGMRKVQSDVRFRIDDLFREHDLVIAFPQRDVHLDSVSPIEVRMVDGGADEPGSE